MDGQTNPVFELGKMFVLFAVVWYMFLKAPNDNNHRFMIYDEVTSKDYVISQISYRHRKKLCINDTI